MTSVYMLRTEGEKAGGGEGGDTCRILVIAWTRIDSACVHLLARVPKERVDHVYQAVEHPKLGFVYES